MRRSPRLFSPALVAAAFLLTAASSIQPLPALAQSYALQPESKIWVDGTSNKSDWTVEATEVDATVSLDGESGVPSSVLITIPSAKMKGDRSTIMDRLMHDALKVDEHPTITFELLEAVASDDGSSLSTSGNLTLAGVTREIQMDVTVEETADGLRYTGSTPLKMSEYNIKPPVAMFGALRTADDVTVGFDVVLAPES